MPMPQYAEEYVELIQTLGRWGYMQRHKYTEPSPWRTGQKNNRLRLEKAGLCVNVYIFVMLQITMNWLNALLHRMDKSRNCNFIFHIMHQSNYVYRPLVIIWQLTHLQDSGQVQRHRHKDNPGPARVISKPAWLLMTSSKNVWVWKKKWMTRKVSSI